MQKIKTLFTVVVLLLVITDNPSFLAHATTMEEHQTLDAETKEKVDAILNNLNTELAKLGISFPKHHDKDQFTNLDDETKTKLKEIMDQVKNGFITKEEAQTKLEELDISLPKRPDIFANLDEETKAKAQVLIEEAKAELKELGIAFPSEKFHHLME